MSEPIGPGDWVECVDASRRYAANTSASLLRAGALYRVEWVCPGDCESDSCVGIDGLRSFDPSGGFAAGRFRPTYRRRDAESLTEKLLVGALSGVPAKVVREGSRETIKSELPK